MAHPVNIEALADEALALVSQEQEKIASAEDYEPALHTDIGKALKQAAELIRQSSGQVTNEDLQIAKVAGRKKDPTRSIKEMYADRKARLKRSKLGEHFHQLSVDVKAQGSALEENKAIKVSHLINAAVGLRHLKGN